MTDAAPRAFVAGWPIRHSRSPLIHGTWLRRLSLPGTYERVAVPPDDFADFVRSLRTEGWAGGNVTIPHKEAAFALADRRDEAATRIGAVNTLWFEGDRLVGGNTDAYGFASNLDRQIPGWRDAASAVVLGAGGAARAVVHALLEAGIGRVAVRNRTRARAEALAASFGARVVPLADDDADLANCDLLVNTRAHEADASPPALHTLPSGALVADIVYVPLETPLLAAASARGHRVSDGLGMLLHQAVPGFERWFGRRPEVDADLRARVLADIDRTP